MVLSASMCTESGNVIVPPIHQQNRHSTSAQIQKLTGVMLKPRYQLLVISVVSLFVSVSWKLPDPSLREYGPALAMAGNRTLAPSRSSLMPNVIFLMIDDLRPALGIYGDPLALTPNLDLLGSQSIVFKNAFAQYASGGPSRVSILTSRRPHSVNLYDTSRPWRSVPDRNYSTLAETFKRQGYQTLPLGQIFHQDYDDYPISWSKPKNPYDLEIKDRIGEFCRKPGFSQIVCPVSTEDLELRNTRLVDRSNLHWAQTYLRERSFKFNPKPMFLALGFHRPSVPWNIPQDFPNLFPLDSIPQRNHTSRSASTPKFAYSDYVNFRESPDFAAFHLDSEGPLNEVLRKLVTQYYYASVTYVDNMIGQLLDTLSTHKLLDKTIITVVSDHGFALGENGELGGGSNFDAATRVPWMVYDPLHTNATLKEFKVKSPMSGRAKKGAIPFKTVDDPVELLDVFPTLLALAGLEPVVECTSRSDQVPCTEGISQAHLLTDPQASQSARPSARAFSQYPRTQLDQLESAVDEITQIATMGYSVRTRDYRYTEWVKWDNERKAPLWNQILAQELYEHHTLGHENDNLSHMKALKGVMSNLSLALKAAFPS